MTEFLLKRKKATNKQTKKDGILMSALNINLFRQMKFGESDTNKKELSE